MPKQKQYNLKRYQGASAANTRPVQHAAPTRSVNAILGDLRIADDATALAIKKKLSENATSTSLPPEVDRIIDPHAVPPPPVQVARPFARARRFAGPAPPSSWLRGDLSGSGTSQKDRLRRLGTRGQDARERQLHRFERLSDGAPGEQHPKSLLHLSMRKLAKHWHDLDPAHYEMLAQLLPLNARVDLLCYLGAFTQDVSVEAVMALISGSTKVEYLDLAGLTGNASPVMQTLRYMIKQEQKDRLSTEPLDSWEQESPTLPASVSGGKFASLTHLCLSHPGPSASWKDLLKLTKLTPALTHLSVAYWPKPTLTPNLVTTVVSHQSGLNVQAGGTHFYSELDEDVSEQSALLRQLSANTLRLRWLDIEGVAILLKAMVAIERQARPADVREDEMQSAYRGLTGTWKSLAYIRIAGDNEKKIRPKEAGLYFPGGDRLVERAAQLKGIDEDELLQISVACREIELARRASKCPPITYDLGWNWTV